MSGQSYTQQLRTLNQELKIINAKAKEIREQKKRVEKDLYYYMDRHQITEIEGFQKDKLYQPPKPKLPSKKPSEKKRDGVELFRQVGIVNAEQFYEEWLGTQRAG